MIERAPGKRIWLAAGVTGHAARFPRAERAGAERVLNEQPYSGHVFVFRGRCGDIVKLLWGSDGDGLCLFAKRLERGRNVAHNIIVLMLSCL